MISTAQHLEKFSPQQSQLRCWKSVLTLLKSRGEKRDTDTGLERAAGLPLPTGAQMFLSLQLAWLEVFLQTVALMHISRERQEIRFLAPPTISALDEELKMF